MKDQGISLNKDCPCERQDCPILGNCVLCVQGHLKHRRHIPECFQDMLRPGIKAIAGLLEFETKDTRPEAGKKT